MSGFCDRCNERSSHLVNIAHLPELAAVAHLAYRQVCAPCYDDLLAEANEAMDLGEESSERVSIMARVEGNTSQLEPFSEEITIEEISPSGVRSHTTRALEPGAVLKLVIPAQDFEATAIVKDVRRENGRQGIELKLVEPSDGWDRIWEQHRGE
jgi:hypothetical protein